MLKKLSLKIVAPFVQVLSKTIIQNKFSIFFSRALGVHRKARDLWLWIGLEDWRQDFFQK